MDVWTDFPERLLPGVQLYAGESHQPLFINTLRTSNQALLISFAGIETPEAAGLYRNTLVYVRAEDRPELPEGDYYHHQLLGMQVVREDGEILGEVTQILQTGSNDVYVVTTQTGKEILLPAIDPVMLNVDLDKREITVRILPGLETV